MAFIFQLNQPIRVRFYDLHYTAFWTNQAVVTGRCVPFLPGTLFLRVLRSIAFTVRTIGQQENECTQLNLLQRAVRYSISIFAIGLSKT